MKLSETFHHISEFVLGSCLKLVANCKNRLRPEYCSPPNPVRVAWTCWSIRMSLLKYVGAPAFKKGQATTSSSFFSSGCIFPLIVWFFNRNWSAGCQLHIYNSNVLIRAAKNRLSGLWVVWAPLWRISCDCSRKQVSSSVWAWGGRWY